MDIEAIKALIVDELKEAIDLVEIPNASPAGLIVPADKLLSIAKLLHSHPSTYFDSLSNLTAVDNGPKVGSMEVVYHLYSIPFNLHLSLKVVLVRNQEGEKLPEVPSLTSIWKTANWHEREAYDLFGIHFIGHPDLRRILLPGDWEGYPMRKDYEEQAYYHGIKVKY